MENHTSKLAALAFAFAAVAGIAAPAAANNAKVDVTGQQLAFDNKKGNCLACHAIPGDPKAVTSANIGPPLEHMKARFPDKSKLREQIWDPMRNNPNTVMPPFGKHKILTEKEIDMIVDYIYGL